MALQEFERRLERLVEGVFAKAFRRGVTPIEVGRRITREMDVHRTVGVRGLLAPNKFTITLAADDYEHFAQMENHVKADLAAYAREHAKQEGYRLVGPVEIELAATDSATIGKGEFSVTSEMVENEDGGTTGILTLGDGSRIRVAADPISIGRGVDNDVVLSDPSMQVSRQHAEIRRVDHEFLLVDLDSVNGTRVNGSGVKEHWLKDGDQITIGPQTLRFELE